MNTVGVTDYTKRHPLSISEGKKMYKFITRQKWKKIFNKCAKISGAHLQCMKNHHAKFKYKVMKTVGFTDYTN